MSEPSEPPPFGEWRKLHPSPTSADVIARLKAVNEYASRHPGWCDQNFVAILWERETIEAWADASRIPAWVDDADPPAPPAGEGADAR